MPMKDWDWTPPPKNVTETPVINLKAGHAFKEAIDRYMRQHMGLGIRPRRRLCMSCRFEGRVTPVGPKVRFCEDCAKERVTESNHRAQTKWRAKQA